MKINVKYFGNVEPLEIITEGDWIDLRSRRNIVIEPGESCMIPLGVAMELPEGYEAHVLPRSSTFKKYGIIMTNSMGIIDHSYCGDGDEWHFPAYALKRSDIRVNDRIAQFRIVKSQFCEPVTIEKVDHLGNEDRGGFGSTGR